MQSYKEYPALRFPYPMIFVGIVVLNRKSFDKRPFF